MNLILIKIYNIKFLKNILFLFKWGLGIGD